MESRKNNVVKIIAATVVAAVISVIVELIMFNQYHYSLSSGTVIGRIALIIVLVIVVSACAAWDRHFSNYATILVMLYYGIIDFGGVMQIHLHGWLGILMRIVALAGIFLCLYGIVLGLRQRSIYQQNRYQDKRGKQK